jgi:hypothetical protein
VTETVIKNAVASATSSLTADVTLVMPVEFDVAGSPGDDLIVTWAPEPAGEVFASPIASDSTGILDKTVVANGSGTVVSLTGQATSAGENALLFAVTDAAGTWTVTGADGFAPGVLSEGNGSGGFTLQNDDVAAGAVPASATMTVTGNWIAAVATFGVTTGQSLQEVLYGGTPNRASSSGGFAGGTSAYSEATLTLNHAVTGGNGILVVLYLPAATLFSGVGVTVPGAINISISDNLGNAYFPIVNTSVSTSTFPGPPAGTTNIALAAFYCANAKVGATTITVPFANGDRTGSFDAFATEIVGFGIISGIPTFKPVGEVLAAAGLNSISTVEIGGVALPQRQTIDFIDGTGVTITGVDNPITGVTEVTVSASGGGGGGAFQSAQRVSWISADGADTTIQQVGDNFPGTDNTVYGSVAPITGRGAGVEYEQQFGGGTAFFVHGNTNYRTGRNIKLWAEVYYTATGDSRNWIGMFDSTSYGVAGSDTPGASQGTNYAAFRFSNTAGGAGDTVWMACTGNGAADTQISTGIAPDTNSHIFAISFVDATPNILFYIDGVLVATATATMPSANTNLGGMMSAEYTTTSYRMGFSQAQIFSDR